MDKTEYRAVIKFLVLEGQSSKQVEERLTSVYGQSSPSSSTIKRWVKEFQRGRESLEDDPRSGRPTTSTSPENIEKVHKLVIENRRISLYELEEATGISYGSIHNILHDELHMSKVCARWVPKMLSDDMKQSRVTISGAMLTRYNTNPDDFHFRVVTCDETWLYHYDPESKQESMEWKHATSPKTKKFKATRSTKKVMSTIFWDSKGVIHIDYLPHGTTMNGKYYANLLKQVRQSIKEKRRGKIRRGIMLHQDNAPVHTSRVAMDAVRECGYELLPHPPYSPDLAPSDFHLFPRLKKHLRGRRFDDDGELTAAVEGWLGDQDVDFYRSGINDWKTRWDKCVELEGDYVEKIKQNKSKFLALSMLGSKLFDIPSYIAIFIWSGIGLATSGQSCLCSTVCCLLTFSRPCGAASSASSLRDRGPWFDTRSRSLLFCPSRRAVVSY